MEKIFISPFVFTPLEHLKFIEKKLKTKKQTHKIRSRKMSGLQPIRSVLQPTENCRRKLKNQLFSIFQKLQGKASQGLQFLLKQFFQIQPLRGRKMENRTLLPLGREGVPTGRGGGFYRVIPTPTYLRCKRLE